MTTVRVRRASDPWEAGVEADGVTVAAAVRRAAWTLVGPGKSLGGSRDGTHEWDWTWSRKGEPTALRVRESRSGPSGSGERQRKVVCVSLSVEALTRLDEVAADRRLTRSGMVEELVMASAAAQ